MAPANEIEVPKAVNAAWVTVVLQNEVEHEIECWVCVGLALQGTSTLFPKLFSKKKKRLRVKG